MMIIYALLAIAITAIGGLVLASHVLRAKLAPWPLSLLHAALGATGLLLLIAVLLQGAAPQRAGIGALRRTRSAEAPALRPWPRPQAGRRAGWPTGPALR